MAMRRVSCIAPTLRIPAAAGPCEGVSKGCAGSGREGKFFGLGSGNR